MSGVTTRGKAAKAAKSTVPSTLASDTPSSHPPQMEQEKDTEAAEQARLDRLAKHEDIKQAWQKRNNMIFRGAGKMTAGAYIAAVSKVQWEHKFLVKGTKKQVIMSYC